MEWIALAVSAAAFVVAALTAFYTRAQARATERTATAQDESNADARRRTELAVAEAEQAARDAQEALTVARRHADAAEDAAAVVRQDLELRLREEHSAMSPGLQAVAERGAEERDADDSAGRGDPWRVTIVLVHLGPTDIDELDLILMNPSPAGPLHGFPLGGMVENRYQLHRGVKAGGEYRVPAIAGDMGTARLHWVARRAEERWTGVLEVQIPPSRRVHVL